MLLATGACWGHWRHLSLPFQCRWAALLHVLCFPHSNVQHDLHRSEVSDPGAHASPGLLTPDFAVPRLGRRHQCLDANPANHNWRMLRRTSTRKGAAFRHGVKPCKTPTCELFDTFWISLFFGRIGSSHLHPLSRLWCSKYIPVPHCGHTGAEAPPSLARSLQQRVCEQGCPRLRGGGVWCLTCVTS